MKRVKITRRDVLEFIVPPICAAVGFCLIAAAGLAIYLLLYGG